MAIILNAEDFDPRLAPEDSRLINAAIIKTLSGTDQWSVPPALVRELRKLGKGPFPPAPKSPRAETLEITGPRGPLGLRIIGPRQPKAVYLHLHGGGWTLGGNDMQDPWFELFAERAGITTVSVDYGLAPEAPYPCGPDDCEAAALWLMRESEERFGTGRLLIGGESAGAHLSVVTLLRLRDRHGVMPFAGANLHAGCYDLALSPSARRWGEEKLVLNTRDIEMFVRHFLLRGGDVRDGDISPIHADLRGLPPALFTVGSRDALLDDTLLMAPKWLGAGNEAELNVYNGGCHVFIGFAGSNTDRCFKDMTAFFARCAA